MTKAMLGHLATLGRGKAAAAKPAEGEDPNKQEEGAEGAAEGAKDGEENGGQAAATAAPKPAASRPAKQAAAAATPADIQAAVLGERERCASIIGAEEAQGRETMAAHLAFETDLDAETAIGLLATAPEGGAKASVPAGGKPAGGGLGLTEAMNAGGASPKLGPAGKAGDGGKGDDAAFNAALAEIKKL